MKYAAFALIILAVGCDRGPNLKSVKLPSNIVIEKPAFANVRFVPTNTSALAFDTQTGVLCKTYPWEMDHSNYYRELDSRVIPVCSEIPDSEKRHAEHLVELQMRDREEAQKEVAMADARTKK